MISINKTSKDKVIEALTDYPATRDSDNLLVGYIWKGELEGLGYDIRNLPTNQFFNLMYLGELTTYETIRRIRAKLQSEDESFRGKRYLKRANKKELIQADLFNFDFI